MVSVSTISTIDTTIGTAIARVSTVTNSTISRYTPMSIIYSCNDSNIVGVTSGIGISLRKSIGNLTNGVGIRITVSLTLAIVSTIGTTIGTTISTKGTTIAKVSTVSNGTIARYYPISIIYSSDHTWSQSIGNLANGVSISISLGLTVSQSCSSKKDKSKASHFRR